jgi:hypothetical protein
MFLAFNFLSTELEEYERHASRLSAGRSMAISSGTVVADAQ